MPRQTGVGTSGLRATLLATTAVIGWAGVAEAGGLAVREQSATHQGASFAGNAAGTDLSASFWNSAAIGNVDGPPGTLVTESHASVIFPLNEFSNATLNGLDVGGSSAEVDNIALVPSSYMA